VADKVMVWRRVIAALLRSGTVISMAGGVTGTGVYVSYTDWTRYRRMMTKYTTGNILPPMAENTYETVYFPRPKLEQVRKTASIRPNQCSSHCIFRDFKFGMSTVSFGGEGMEPGSRRAMDCACIYQHTDV